MNRNVYKTIVQQLSRNSYFAANFHLPPEIPNVLPQLNPNQPHLEIRKLIND